MSTLVKSDYFVADQNVYDISEAGAEVMAAANDLFATGDAVTVATGSRFSATKTIMVNRGGQVDIVGLSALLLPFESDVTGTQDASISLSDASTVSVGFDAASGDISVGGASYSDGSQFVLDGRKVSVFVA